MRRMFFLLCVLFILMTVFSVSVYAETGWRETIDMSKWQYNESDDVYWQIGVQYCSNPADSSYETMGIFVPGAYFNNTQQEVPHL